MHPACPGTRRECADHPVRSPEDRSCRARRQPPPPNSRSLSRNTSLRAGGRSRATTCSRPRRARRCTTATSASGSRCRGGRRRPEPRRRPEADDARLPAHVRVVPDRQARTRHRHGLEHARPHKPTSTLDGYADLNPLTRHAEEIRNAVAASDFAAAINSSDHNPTTDAKRGADEAPLFAKASLFSSRGAEIRTRDLQSPRLAR